MNSSKRGVLQGAGLRIAYSYLAFRGPVPDLVDFRRSFQADELISVFDQPITIGEVGALEPAARLPVSPPRRAHQEVAR